MKCQKCAKPATFHITDIERGKPREFHFCDEHARQHLAPPEEAPEPPPMSELAKKLIVSGPGPPASRRRPTSRSARSARSRFLEFRNSGRLGCPYDYEVFRDELMPLLENIHDETRHSGKVPERAPRNTPAADDADPAPQRAEAGRRRRGLRDGRAGPRQDQGDRTGAGTMTTRRTPCRRSPSEVACP